MSTGHVCICADETHPPRNEAILPAAFFPGRCSRYAADQELGGYCASCASGWHAPCDRPRFTPGACALCGWHGSDHPGGIR